jgi:hypothetical protein
MIKVKLTNGFGNNLFQFIAAKQLATFHNTDLQVVCSNTYYGIEELKNLGLEFEIGTQEQSDIICDDNNYTSLFTSTYSGKNILLTGYFEDYNYYMDNIDLIKEWFGTIDSVRDCLTIHLRAGDRLLVPEISLAPKVENWLRAIEKFTFDKLYIVTDMPEWKKIDIEYLSSLKFHNHPNTDKLDMNISVNHFNSLVDGFSKFKPIHIHQDISDDFNFIRSSKNILFEHGTLSWWAAATSNAEKVGVYGPWRSWKGDSNKNLSKIPLKGWFGWE